MLQRFYNRMMGLQSFYSNHRKIIAILATEPFGLGNSHVFKQMISNFFEKSMKSKIPFSLFSWKTQLQLQLRLYYTKCSQYQASAQGLAYGRLFNLICRLVC